MPPKPIVLWRHKNILNPEANRLRNKCTWASACVRGQRSVVLYRDRVHDLGGNYEQEGRMIENLDLDTGYSINKERRWPFWTSTGVVMLERDRSYMPDRVKSKSLETGFQGFRLHWKKVIAQGGFGMATLWEVEFEDGHREDVVIKMALDADTDLHEEFLWHNRYRLASSIVQARDLVQEANEHKDANRFQRGEKFNPPKENVLVLEYMRLGNLCTVFEKAAMMKRKFPSNALWQLWESLVLGVAEVAYQQELRQASQQGLSDMFWSHVAEGPEFVEDFLELLKKLPISHDVHFDLEETNILVTQDEGGEYIFKLHDFGTDWSKDMRSCWEDWPEREYWERRGQIKPGKNLPEQHAKEWDSLEHPNHGGTLPFTSETFGHRLYNSVAGRYGSWTNVFIIARTLESAITLNRCVHPFIAKRVDQQDPDVTYGWRVHPADYPHVDSKLISILLRCMREDPPRRDSIVQLLRDIAQARAEGKMDTDDNTGDFWDNVFQPCPHIFQDQHEDSSTRYQPPSSTSPPGSDGRPQESEQPQQRDPMEGLAPLGSATRRRSVIFLGARERFSAREPAQSHPPPERRSNPPKDRPAVLKPIKDSFKTKRAAKSAKAQQMRCRIEYYSGRLGEDLPPAIRSLRNKNEQARGHA